ncbi:MAG TPA: ferrous iron transport protein A [Desulfobulbaceae bacterium]|nr:ferrous iron transport protein A [Desulfobulbaceae bacterium]
MSCAVSLRDKKQTMTKNHPDISCHCHRGKNGHCFLQEQPCPVDARPLSKACRNGRVKVCKIGGSRKICAKMAHLGVMPGTEMELLCPRRGRQCMIKVNGGTLSLDEATADNIFVTTV